MQDNSPQKSAQRCSTTLNQLAKKVNEINGPDWLRKSAKNTPSFGNQKLNHFSTSWLNLCSKTYSYRWLTEKDGCGDGPLMAAGWLRGLPVGQPSPPTKAGSDQPEGRIS